MVLISVKEPGYEELNQDTLADSTPRKEGGGDTQGESKSVLANKDLINHNSKTGQREPSLLERFKK
ncbi:MAG: hypothetical protein NVS9B7_22440 [Flavisolibacter sp.]